MFRNENDFFISLWIYFWIQDIIHKIKTTYNVI